MPRILPEIDSLDPVRGHERIVFLSCRYDFPWDTTRSLEFALFRSYIVPSISALLDHTGEFAQRPQKRYDDTDIIISEIMEYGYSSERGQRYIEKMNAIHGRFKIKNEDFLYVLSTFVFEPIRWNERFGWRRMTDKERLALFYFWVEVGRRMHMHDLPTDYDQFEAFNREYEKRHCRFTESSRRIGTATRDLFMSWAPAPFRPVVKNVIHAMLDDAMIEAFGFPKPSRTWRRMVAGGLKLRGQLVRMLPRRKKPLLRTEMRQHSYPEGYTLEALGPPSFQSQTADQDLRSNRFA